VVYLSGLGTWSGNTWREWTGINGNVKELYNAAIGLTGRAAAEKPAASGTALVTPSWTTPHHKSPLDEINEIRRNAADSLWVLKVTRRRILPLTAII